MPVGAWMAGVAGEPGGAAEVARGGRGRSSSSSRLLSFSSFFHFFFISLLPHLVVDIRVCTLPCSNFAFAMISWFSACILEVVFGGKQMLSLMRSDASFRIC